MRCGCAATLAVPGEVMKGKKSEDVKEHRVPLPAAALDVLARAYTLANGTTATPAELPRLAALRACAAWKGTARPGEGAARAGWVRPPARWRGRSRPAPRRSRPGALTAQGKAEDEAGAEAEDAREG